MKTHQIIIPLLSVWVVCLMSCKEDVINTGLGDKDSLTVKPGDTLTISQLKSAITGSGNNFAFQIFKAIENNEENSANIFISPLSIYYALTMAGNGAEGETKQEFQEVLGLDGLDEEGIRLAIGDLYNEIIPEGDDVILEIANSIWPKVGFPIKQNFIDETEDYFMADVKPLDFGATGAVDSINNWIENKTHDKIRDMLDEISPAAALYLINAIYFNGKWKYQFADTSNFENAFYKEDGSSINVTYMKLKAPLKYFQNSIFSAAKLPYTDSNYYMMVMLPNHQKNIDDILNNMNGDNWVEWNDSFDYKEVIVDFPKFKYSFGARNINEELIQLGLETAFTDKANFSRISDIPLIISRVLHKAFIEVNEKGSEAAAATIIEFVYTCADCGSQTTHFIVNKPFIFIIGQENSNNILFVGKVAWPEQ